MKDLIISIFGEYSPVMDSIVNDAGETVETIAPGVAGVDWPYVLGVLGFFLTLYCVLRILGAVISRV